jgi:hypothetical protein
MGRDRELLNSPIFSETSLTDLGIGVVLSLCLELIIGGMLFINPFVFSTLPYIHLYPEPSTSELIGFVPSGIRNALKNTLQQRINRFGTDGIV